MCAVGGWVIFENDLLLSIKGPGNGMVQQENATDIQLQEEGRYLRLGVKFANTAY